MATIEEELRSALIANSSVYALVADRIYPDVARENTPMPCIVYERFDSSLDDQSFTLDGPGLYRTNVVLSSLGKTWESAHSVADAVKLALENVKGPLTATQNVELIIFKNLSDQGYEELPQSYRFDLQFEVVTQ